MTIKRAKKSAIRKSRSRRRQDRIERRLRRAALMKDVKQGRPMLGSSAVDVELSNRVEGHDYGGLGPMVSMVQKLGLKQRLNDVEPPTRRVNIYRLGPSVDALVVSIDLGPDTFLQENVPEGHYRFERWNSDTRLCSPQVQVRGGREAVARP